MDPLEKIIRPIVEGQIRGFINEHPSILVSVDWYKPRHDRATTLTNSLSKRIIRDLVCPTVRARMMAALLESATGEASAGVAGTVTGASPPGLGFAADPGETATAMNRVFTSWIERRRAILSR
jgi:hypothetical protein